MGENAFAQRSQLLEQRIRKGAPKDGAGKQIENVHRGLVCCRPSWQPHSVMPFRGDGERWSLAFNVVAAPGVPPTAMQQPAPQQQPLGNVSLSSQRPRAKGF